MLSQKLLLMADDVSLSGVSEWSQDNTSGFSTCVNHVQTKSYESLADNFRIRFERGRNFTEIGGLFLAYLNPWRTVFYYKEAFADFYRNASSFVGLPPHLYRLCRWCHDSVIQRHIDMCIIFHGESGSGKSESFKRALYYFTQVDRGPSVGRTALTLKRVRCVLEAFGCAWTINNRPSTKFTELLEVGLDFNGFPENIKITVLPLHKFYLSSSKNAWELNYTAFYVLLLGADSQLLSKRLQKNLKLQRNPLNYAYLKTCGAHQQHQHLSAEVWKEQFSELKLSLNELSFSSEETDDIFKTLAFILKLGNVKFQFGVNLDGTTICCIQDDFELNDLAKVFGCGVDLVRETLTKHTCAVGAESLSVDLSEEEADNLRNLVCCTLYSRLWIWLTGKMNTFCKSDTDRRFNKLYLLDVSGYNDALKNDSFDQFLSNYANERIYENVFRKNFEQLQADFTSDGLHWTNIDTDFDDVVLERLEIYTSLLDRAVVDNEQSDGDKSVVTFCHDNVVVTSCENSTDLRNATINKRQQSENQLTVKHYFGVVQYDTKGFREKNLWTISGDYLRLFHVFSNVSLFRTLFPEKVELKSPKLKKKPLSVAAQYKVALNSILHVVENVQCAHVLCLKSNDTYRSAYFDEACVERQLKVFNVLETVQLFANGFAESETYDDCLKRYKMLSGDTWPRWSDSSRQGVANIVKSVDLSAHHLAYGRQRLFFKRIETLAQLEERRQRELHKLATVIQKAFRAWLIRRKHTFAHKSQTIIAARFRAFKAKREYEAKKRGALIIAVYYRRWKVRRAFRLKRELAASEKIFRFLKTACKKLYLLRLLHALPSLSPICQSWPEKVSPSFCKETDALLKLHYHRWRCRKYRQLVDQQTYFRMREKVAASVIFNGRKAGYSLTIAHSFRGDYVRIRQNPRWKKVALENNDEYVVFADIANKVHRTTGKVSSILLVLSTNGVLILDHRTLTIKHRVSITDVDKISTSPFIDPVAVFHMKDSFLSRKSGDFLFECRHIVELIAKLYLVVQNATGKPPLVIIAQEIGFVVENEKMQLVFNKKNDAEITSDEASSSVGCFSSSPSMTIRPTTPTPVANSNKTPTVFKSSDDTNLDSIRSPQIHRLKLVRKGTRLDIFV